MPTTATIESVEFVNSFPSQYGDANGNLHAYFYRFSDGAEGEANHKAAPSWGPGDEVDYEMQGQRNGVNKLKVTKVGGQQNRPQGGGNRAPARSGPSGGQRQGPGPQGPQNGGKPSASDYAEGQRLSREGQRLGACLNNAALDMRAHFEPAGLGSDEDVKAFLWSRASLYLRLSQAFEAGKIAPLPRGEALPTEAPRSEPVRQQAAPPPAARAPRSQPVTEREAANQATDPEDVPF